HAQGNTPAAGIAGTSGGIHPIDVPHIDKQFLAVVIDRDHLGAADLDRTLPLITGIAVAAVGVLYKGLGITLVTTEQVFAAGVLAIEQAVRLVLALGQLLCQSLPPTGIQRAVPRFKRNLTDALQDIVHRIENGFFL